MVDGVDAVRADRSAPRDWGKWRDYRAMYFSSLSDTELVPCETCGRPTDKTDTKLCDGCWEVERRLYGYLADGGRAAARVLITALMVAVLPEDGPCGECGHPHPLAHLRSGS